MSEAISMKELAETVADLKNEIIALRTAYLYLGLSVPKDHLDGTIVALEFESTRTTHNESLREKYAYLAHELKDKVKSQGSIIVNSDL